jgi:hypothetical protein
MPSITVTGQEYLQNALGVEEHGPFTYRFLAEGDSWMDRSTLMMGSLPQFLGAEMDKQRHSALVINISTAGDTLRRITDTMQGEFAWWLRQFRYDGILFSAGGNDFIDAARDPGPGQGLLRNMEGRRPPTDGYRCVNQQAVTTLVERYMNPNFNAIYQTIRGDPQNKSTPIFLNSYDIPTVRDAPAMPGVGPWLYAAYQKNHIAPALWPSLTAGIFKDIRAMVNGWCNGRKAIHAVPTSGVLTPARQGTSGSDGDWANEIHPNKSGWKKLASVWASELLTQLA